MEFLYTDKEVSYEMVSELLVQLFPSRNIIYWDFFLETFDELYKSDDLIVFDIEYDPDKLEFGCKISIHRTPEENTQERALHLGRQLADRLHKRVLTPFTHPDQKDDPYMDIIFDKGQSFLADDLDTNFGDGSNGKVKIVEEYKLPDFKFDTQGKLIY